MSANRLRNGTKRKYIVGAVASAALIVALSFWTLGRDNTMKSPYMTASVDRMSIVNTVAATGTLEAVRTVQVGSQISGQVSALYADYNDIVKKGQVVATIDPRPSASQVATAQAHLSSSEARLRSADADLLNQQASIAQNEANVKIAEVAQQNAKLMLDRALELESHGLVSKNDLDTAKTNADSADAKLMQAKATLDQARIMIKSREASIDSAKSDILASRADLDRAQINLGLTKIYSPVDGVVISRNINIGQTVAASLQAPVLFTIANDLTQMQVKASVDEADIGKLTNDAAVRFTVDAYPNDVFNGTISEVRLEPQTVQNVVTYSVIIGVANPEMKLKPGMTANLTITVDKRDDVLAVPTSALRFTPEGVAQQDIAKLLQSKGSAGGNGGLNRQSKQDGQERPAGARPQRVVIWTLDAVGTPQPIAVRLGISDGAHTEVIAQDLQEGTPVITGDLSKKEASTGSGSRQSTSMPFAMPGMRSPRGGGR